MNENVDQLDQLLTGCEETDQRIRDAYDLGLRQGRELDRENVRRNAQIQTTRTLLNSLMCTQGMDLRAAMCALRIPKAERKTYEKIFASKRK